MSQPLFTTSSIASLRRRSHLDLTWTEKAEAWNKSIADLTLLEARYLASATKHEAADLFHKNPKENHKNTKTNPWQTQSHITVKIADNYTTDSRNWPDPTEPRPSKLPLEKGCTCNEGHKLDCPVHGLHAPEPDISPWAYGDQANPVGYAQDAPANHRFNLTSGSYLDLINQKEPRSPEEQYPNGLFHAAPTTERNRIKTWGLQQSNPQYGSQPTGVYATPEPETTAFGPGDDIWKIDPKYIDPKNPPVNDGLYSGGNASIIRHVVPPEALTLHTLDEDRLWNNHERNSKFTPVKRLSVYRETQPVDSRESNPQLNDTAIIVPKDNPLLKEEENDTPGQVNRTWQQAYSRKVAVKRVLNTETQVFNRLSTFAQVKRNLGFESPIGQLVDPFEHFAKVVVKRIKSANKSVEVDFVTHAHTTLKKSNRNLL